MKYINELPICLGIPCRTSLHRLQSCAIRSLLQCDVPSWSHSSDEECGTTLSLRLRTWTFCSFLFLSIMMIAVLFSNIFLFQMVRRISVMFCFYIQLCSLHTLVDLLVIVKYLIYYFVSQLNWSFPFACWCLFFHIIFVNDLYNLLNSYYRIVYHK